MSERTIGRSGEWTEAEDGTLYNENGVPFFRPPRHDSKHMKRVSLRQVRAENAYHAGLEVRAKRLGRDAAERGYHLGGSQQL